MLTVPQPLPQKPSRRAKPSKPISKSRPTGFQELLGHIIGGTKVFLGGGQDANGIELADKVQDSANERARTIVLSVILRG